MKIEKKLNALLDDVKDSHMTKDEVAVNAFSVGVISTLLFIIVLLLFSFFLKYFDKEF